MPRNSLAHRTVSKHYQMERQYHDACIDFRVVPAKS